MGGSSRRRLLMFGGTALAGALAGCSGGADENEEPNGNEDENGDEDDGSDAAASDRDPTGGTTLGEISVENVHDDTHTVDVIVEFGDEIEHWTTHELAADSGTTLERDWSTDPGPFRVMARLDEGDPTQITPSKWNEPSCLNLFVLVDRNGELTILSDTDGGPCGDGDAAFGDADEDA